MYKKMVFIFLGAVLLISIVACSNNTTPSASGDGAPQNAIISELKIIELASGEGDAALDGSKVAVHYSGWSYDETAENNKGKLFDTSSDLAEPLVFTLGTGRVIKGWDIGIVGMKVGGKRRLLIPSELAYGGKRIGTARTAIPANSALVFDVELIELGITK